ncbi:MAG: GNAT family N-acetyltransferase [Deltaproteobacteria bacterium]|nr:GNAT family N-acetyltransferase [Deltaproteobacteria bacterium]
MMSDMVMPRFLKVATLRGGERVVIRPFEPNDKEKLLDFFRRLPAEERASMREDVTDPAVIDKWIRNIDPGRGVSIIAEVEDRVVGDGTLYKWPHGWHRHICEIRLVVDGAHRKQGLGTIILTELFSLALQFDLDKIVAAVMKEQTVEIAMLERMGFRKEAEFKDHIMDLAGRKHDMVILTHYVAVLWEHLHDSEDFQVRLNQMED